MQENKRSEETAPKVDKVPSLLLRRRLSNPFHGQLPSRGATFHSSDASIRRHSIANFPRHSKSEDIIREDAQRGRRKSMPHTAGQGSALVCASRETPTLPATHYPVVKLDKAPLKKYQQSHEIRRISEASCSQQTFGTSCRVPADSRTSLPSLGGGKASRPSSSTRSFCDSVSGICSDLSSTFSTEPQTCRSTDKGTVDKTLGVQRWLERL